MAAAVYSGMVNLPMSYGAAHSIESGYGVRKQKRRNPCNIFCTAVLAGVCACAALAVCCELYRYEVREAIRTVERVMAERETQCLSTHHVGRDDYNIIVLGNASAPNEKRVIMNPSIFSLFGETLETQEFAHPPTQCGGSSTKAAYPIHRTRHSKATVRFVPVNASDVTWPALSMLPSSTETKTFTGQDAFCIQHVVEVFKQPNPCLELPDERRQHHRIEL